MINKDKLLIVSRSTVYHNKSGGLETQLDLLINTLKSKYYITVLTTKLKTSTKNINEVKVLNEVEYIFLKNTISGSNGFTLFENIFWQIPIKRNTKDFNKNFRKEAALYFNKNLKNKYPIIISQSSAANFFDITTQKLIAIYHGTTYNEIKSRFAGLKSIKDIVRFFGLDIPVMLYELFVNNPKFYSKVSKIILVSSLLKNDFIKQHKKFANKIVVIDNGIDTKKFFPGKNKKLPFKVIYFGRIEFEKGLMGFLAVAIKLPKLVFNVFGSGIDAKEFSAILKKENLPNLKYYGEVDNSEIAKKLSNSHIFLFLTNRKEGFPMSVLEAMASGLVVITTLNLKNINKDFPFLYVTNTEEAVSQLSNLTIYEYSKLSKLSTQFIIKYYSKESMRDKYLEVIKNV